MKTGNLTFLLLALLTVVYTGCQKEEIFFAQDNFFTIKTPAFRANSYTSIVAVRKNSSVEITMNYFDPAWYKESSLSSATPDFYEVYLSKSTPDNFQLIRTIDTSYINRSFTLTGLTNNELYYIYLKEVTDGNEEIKNSNVAVFVPSAFEPSYNFILKEQYGNDLYSFDWNWHNKIAYATHYYEFKPGYSAESIFVIEQDEAPTLVDINCWSPDINDYGTRIAFSSDKGEIFDGKLRPEHISLYDINSKKISRITSGYSVNKYPSWSPDNTLIAFSSSENSDNNLRIKVINPETQYVMSLHTGSGSDSGILEYSQEHPAWSSDGEYIYYTHRSYTNENINPGLFDVYRIQSSGGAPEPVFDFEGIECMPAISPDNSMIAFLSDLSGKLQIWVYNFNDSRYYQPMNTGSYDFSEYWSEIKWKDNSTIYFTAHSRETLVISLFSTTVE